ncbi:striatin-interacting protein 2 isoform X1 [Lates japonicus]|uniref:Striatin-interacting protein 2 isoform X1 n=1 Tax=Lates japonicus TaxID=270547 RepID=A0AAD3RC01_LATJO|nr:striatin-interacting protein 2 isoform X1 [Lates japonicus]
MQAEDMEVPIINNLNDNGDRQRPKGKDVFKDQQKESESSMESPNLEFEYGDTDTLTAELSELYSYTEEPEFALNRDYFEEDFRSHARAGGGSSWWWRSRGECDGGWTRLEVTDRDKRLKVPEPSSTWLRALQFWGFRAPGDEGAGRAASTCLRRRTASRWSGAMRAAPPRPMESPSSSSKGRQSRRSAFVDSLKETVLPKKQPLVKQDSLTRITKGPFKNGLTGRRGRRNPEDTTCIEGRWTPGPLASSSSPPPPPPLRPPTERVNFPRASPPQSQYSCVLGLPHRAPSDAQVSQLRAWKQETATSSAEEPVLVSTLLRILNKLDQVETLEDHVRPILKRALKVKQAMMQPNVPGLRSRPSTWISARRPGTSRRRSAPAPRASVVQQPPLLPRTRTGLHARDNQLQERAGPALELPETSQYSYAEMWLEREVCLQPIQWEAAAESVMEGNGEGLEEEEEEEEGSESYMSLWEQF